MSIAKREAEKLLIFKKIYKKSDLRNNVITLEGANDIAEAAYIAGRTAKPTEAEIDAGAIAIFRTLTTSAHPMSDADYAEAWNCIATMQKDQFKRQSQAVLKAARKEVTE